MIGRVAMDSVLENADVLAMLGGPEIHRPVTGLSGLSVTGPEEASILNRAAVAVEGGVCLDLGEEAPTLVTHDQALDRLLPQWRPVGRGDVLLNLFGAERLWDSHHHVQKLAERTRALVVPTAPGAPGEYGDLISLAAREGVSALAGVPSTLSGFARAALASDVLLPVRTLIWTRGEWTREGRATVERAFRGAGLWGLYGFPGIGVIAFNDPRCDPGRLHLLDDQVLETDAEGALLTRSGRGWTAAVVRYRLADRVEEAGCSCGRTNALRTTPR